MLWFLKRWRVHCDAHWETLRSRPPPSSTVFHFLQVAEVVNTAARNDVRLPGHRWLKPQEVQREDRAAQPEASRGDAGLRTADDRPHCFKGKYTTFHKLIILVIYVIISGYYVTELPAGCLSCFICWLRFLVFNQNFLFSLLAFSMPAYVCQREDEMKTVWWGCSDTLTQTHSLQRPVCFLVSFRSAVQQEMGKWLLCSSATRQKSSLALLRVLRMEQCCLGGLQHACLQTCCLHPPPPLMLISSHELRPEVHPGHCSIYTHHCTGPVLLIIRSTDAQMSPRAKWVHMCFMFLFLMCGNTQLNESVCQVQAWKCSASVITQFVSL